MTNQEKIIKNKRKRKTAAQKDKTEQKAIDRYRM